MTQVYPIRAEQRARIPAVTHVDGSGRLQTVNRGDQSAVLPADRGLPRDIWRADGAQYLVQRERARRLPA